MPETLAHTPETLKFIGENPYLAPSYKDWYTNIVSDSIDLGALSLEQAQLTGQSHPHFIFKKNPFKNIPRINSADTFEKDENYPKLLLIPNGNPFVAICIGRDHTYINNYNRISGILAHSTLSGIV